MTSSGRLARICGSPAPVRDPMIQKVIEGSASCGSAANFTMPTKAVKSAPTTMPESTIIKMEPDSPGRVRLTSITSSMAAVPESTAPI